MMGIFHLHGYFLCLSIAINSKNASRKVISSQVHNLIISYSFIKFFICFQTELLDLVEYQVLIMLYTIVSIFNGVVQEIVDQVAFSSITIFKDEFRIIVSKFTYSFAKFIKAVIGQETQVTQLRFGDNAPTQQDKVEINCIRSDRFDYFPIRQVVRMEKPIPAFSSEAADHICYRF